MDILNSFKKLLLRKGITSPNTLKNYISDVRHFINWFEKTTDIHFTVDVISSDIVRLYQKSLGGVIRDGKIDSISQLSVSSTKRHISSLRKFFSLMLEEGLIKVDPFVEIIPEITHEPTDYWHIKSFKEFLEEQGASKITVKNYTADIQSFARWYEEAILPSLTSPLTATGGFYLITQSILEDYKSRLVEIQNAAPRTVNRKLSVLRRYLDFAAKKGFITRNEIVIDPVRIGTTLTPHIEEVKFTLTEITQEPLTKKYSKIPPFRLAQKLIIFPYLQLEELTANKIATLIAGKKIEGISGISKKLRNELIQKNILRGQNEAISGLLRVRNVAKEFYAPNSISLLGAPIHKKLIHHARYTRPHWYKRYHNYSFVHYVHFSLLVIFAAGVGVALYQNLVSKNHEQASAAPTAPPRILSFQGRLTDILDNPITTNTNLRFAIYNDSTASGGALLWQEVNTAAPDQDGIFSIYLGGGTTIPSTVFSDNASIYLGVTVGTTSELTPRQRIATVGYASNSEFLQGMQPITSLDSSDSKVNTILALDSSGNLIISGDSNPAPTFEATSGQFSLSGNTLYLKTVFGTNSNIVLSPDGLGRIDLHKPLVNTSTMGNIAPGGVVVTDKFAIAATESAVAAFIVSNNSAGGDIIAASASGTTRLVLANDGTLTASAYSGQNGVLYGTFNTGLFAQATTALSGLCLQSGVSNPTWGSCTTGITTSPFQATFGSINPLNSTLDSLFGGQATSSAAFRVIGQGNPFRGTLAAASVSANTSFAGFVIDNRGVGDLFTASSSGVTQLALKNNGALGIGTATPTAKLDVNGNASISSSLTFRNGFSSIQTTANQTLLIGGNTTGNIVLTPNNGSAGTVTINGLLNGLTGLTLSSGAITLGGSTGSSLCLIGGATASWGSCTGTGFASPFRELAGTTVPLNSTWDSLFGGQATSSAAFRVTGQANPFRGTLPAASVSANTSWAGFVVDNKGTGDLFAASQSGVPNFRIKNNGDIVVGQNGSGKITAAVIDPYLIQNQYTDVNTQLTFQTMAASNGDFLFQNQSTLLATLAQAGQLQLPITGSSAGLVIGGDTQIFRGAADRLDVASGDSLNLVSGSLQIGGVTTIDSSRNGSFNAITVSGGCTGCTNSVESPFKMLSEGVIVPHNTTVDFVLGSQATSSARFSVLGIISGQTPTASVSAGTGNGVIIAGNGTIQSTRNNSLILGGATTGNIILTETSFIGGASSGLQVTTTGHISDVNDAAVSIDDDLTLSGTTITASSLSTFTTSATLGINGASTINSDQGTLALFDSAVTNLSIGGAASTLDLGASGGTIRLGNGGASTIATESDDSLTITPHGAGNLVLTSDADSGIYIGSSSNTPAMLSLSGGIGANAGFILNRTGSTDDIFAASASGTTRFVIKNDGTASSSAGFTVNGIGSIQSTNSQTLTIGGGTSGGLILGRSGVNINFGSSSLASCTALETVNGVLGCGTDDLGSGADGVSNWTLSTANGTLSPNNSTLDILVGGTTTQSAKFAILNIAGSQTPSASVSATQNNTAAYISGNGSLQSARNNTLTLGGDTTGNISLLPNNGTGGFVSIGSASNGIEITSTGVIRDINGATVEINDDLQVDGNDILDSGANTRITLGATNTLTGTGLTLSGTTTITASSLSTLTTSAAVVINGAATITTDQSNLTLFNSTATTLSFAGAATTLNIGGAAGTINLGNGGASTLTTVSNDDLTITSHGTGNLILTSDADTQVLIGSAGTTTEFPLFINSGIGSNASLAINNVNTGDLIAASASGATRFLVKNDGTASSSAGFTVNGIGSVQSTNSQTLTIGGGSSGGLVLGRSGVNINFGSSSLASCTALETVNGVLSCGTDDLGSGADGVSNWTLSTANGTLSPNNNTLDILIGGTSSNSAKFAILGVAAGTNPSASVSAGTTGATYVNATGTLQTTANQHLNLGGDTTGNISLTPLNGNGTIHMAGNTTLATNKNLTLSSGTGIYTQNYTGNTTDAFAITASSLTSGSALVLTGPSGGTAGITDALLKLTSDVNDTAGGLAGLATLNATIDTTGGGATGVNLYVNTTNSPSTNANTAYGLRNTFTDNTALANLDYGIYNEVNLSGNAAKTAQGIATVLTSSSTTADILTGSDIFMNVTGIITSGTRNVYGVASAPSVGAESTGGTTNVYGVYSKPSADVAAGGVLNSYGLYAANGTYDTDGTSTAYGLYVEALSGADNNYGIYSAGGGNTFIGKTGLGAIPSSSDYLLTITGDNTQDYSRLIDITQANDAAEDSTTVSLVNTSNLGAITGGTTRTVTNSSLSLAPTADLTSTSGNAVLVSNGIDIPVSLANVTLGDVSSTGRALTTTTAVNASINGSLIINDTTTGGIASSQTLRSGSFSITGSPTLTSLAGGLYTINPAGLFVDANYSSAGNSNLNVTSIGASITAQGNLTTTGTTSHTGINITTAGTADTNYGLNINSVSSADANYGISLGSVADTPTNYAFYSTAEAQSAIWGNLGIGELTPDAKLEVLSTTEQLRLTHTDETIDTRITVDGSGNLAIDASSDGTGSETLTFTGFSTLTGTDFSTVNLSNANLTVASCSGCGSGADGSSNWVLSSANGTLSTINNTLDVLIGGSSSNSAKFAVLGVAAGTNPSASVSAGTNGGTYINANGTLATTAKQTLNLGDSITTGNINANLISANLFNVLSGNLKVGNGTPGVSLNGEDAYIEGTFEVDGAIQLDGATVLNSTLTANGASTFNTDVNMNFAGTENLRIDGTLSTVASGVVDVDVTTDTNGIDILNFQFVNAVDDPTPEADTITGFYLRNNYTDSLDTVYVQNTEFTGAAGSVTTAYLQRLVNTATANNVHPTAFMLIHDNESTGTLADGIIFDMVAATTDAIDTSDPQIVNALNIGDNTILGTTGVIDFSNFDVTAAGALTAASTITFSTFTTNGGLLYTNGSGQLTQITSQGASGECLKSTGTGSAPSFGSCSTGIAQSNWSLSSAQGTLNPINNTLDILVGGTTTQSAKFSVLNIAGSQTPSASVSATQNNTALSISGDGSLQSARRNTLTIGGTTTGDIVLAPNGETQDFLKLLSDGTNLSLLTTDGANLTIGPAGNLVLDSTGGTIDINDAILDFGSQATDFEIIDNTSNAFSISQGVTGYFTITTTNSSETVTIGNTAANTVVAITSGGTGDISINSDDSLFLLSDTDLTIQSSTGTIELLSASTLELNSSGGAISIGNDGDNQNINIGTGGTRTLTLGSTNSSSGIDLIVGSGELDIGDTASNKTIEIGGVDSSGADTISIATNGTAADTLTIGNTNTSTTIAITGGDDWFVTAAGVASFSGTLSLKGTATLQSTANSTLTIGGTETGNVLINPVGGALFGIGTNHPLASIDIRGALATLRGGTTAVASVSGNTSFAALTVDNRSTVGDIFTASQSGMTQFVIRQNGRVGIGGTARIPTAQLDVAGNASVSGALTFRVGTGEIQTTQFNNLAIGGNTTGSITIDPKTSGGVTIGSQFAPNGVAGLAKFAVFGNNSTQPAASISATTTGPALLVINNSSTGDLIAASSSGIKVFSVRRSGDIVLGDGTGKVYGSTIDPLYTIDGKKFSTYGTTINGVKEEYVGSTYTYYNPAEGGYVSVLDFNNFEDESELWVFNRVSDPDIGKINVLLTPNSQARTWFRRDPVQRKIYLYSDRPTELTYRLTAPRFDAANYPSKDHSHDIQGLLAPTAPLPVGQGEADPQDTFFNSLSVQLRNGQYELIDALNNIVHRVDGFSQLIVARFKAGAIEAQHITTNTFAVAANTITIGGQDLRDYIIETIQNANLPFYNPNVISPIAQIDVLKTNIISPLDDSDVSVGIRNSKLEVRNSEGTVAWFDNKGNATFSGELRSDRLAVNNASIAGNLATNTLQTNDASVGGTLRANNIIANNIEGLENKISSIASNLIASNASTGSGSFNGNTLAVNTVNAQFGIFEQGITSMGPITSNILTATDQLAVGSNFTISNNSINTIGADLEIQSLRQGAIAFQGGLIRMDTDGNLSVHGNLNLLGRVNAVQGLFSGGLITPTILTSLISPVDGGDLIVRLKDSQATSSGRLKVTNNQNQEVLSVNHRGDIVASGAATFAKLNFNLVGEAQASSLTEAVATGSAGFATLRAGQPEITIKNKSVTKDSLIYITPFGNTNGKVLYLLRQQPQDEDNDGSFTVGASGSTSTTDLQFNWLLVN